MSYWFSQKYWNLRILITQVRYVKSLSLRFTLDFSVSVSDAGLNSGEMRVSLMLDTEAGVTIAPDHDDGDHDQPPGASAQFRVHHLPPLTLQFTLPPQYPSQVREATSIDNNDLPDVRTRP